MIKALDFWIFGIFGYPLQDASLIHTLDYFWGNQISFKKKIRTCDCATKTSNLRFSLQNPPENAQLEIVCKRTFSYFSLHLEYSFYSSKKKAFTVTPVNTMSDFADISLFYYTVILKVEFWWNMKKITCFSCTFLLKPIMLNY